MMISNGTLEFTLNFEISLLEDVDFQRLSEAQQREVFTNTHMCMTMDIAQSRMEATVLKSWLLLIDKMSFYVATVWVPLMCTLCILGYLRLFLTRRNGRKSCERSRFGHHLVALCVWDILVCLTNLSCNGAIIFFYGGIRTYGRYLAWVTFIVQPLYQVIIDASRWQLLMLSIERCVVVLRPLQMRSMISHVSTKTIFIFVAALAFFTSIPQYLAEFKVEPCLEPHTLKPAMERTRTFFFDLHPLLNIVFNVIPFVLIRAPMPFIILLITTLVTMSYTIRSRSMAHYKPASRLTMILAMINFKYLLTSIPFMIYVICEQLYTHKDITEERSQRVYMLALFVMEMDNIFQTAHCATNWILLVDYSTGDKKQDNHILMDVKAESDGRLNDHAKHDGRRRKTLPTLRSLHRARSSARSTSPQPKQCFPNISLSTMVRIKDTWARNNRGGRFGRELLVQVCARNPHMASHICAETNVDDLHFSQDLARLGQTISKFLDSIISNPGWTEERLFGALRDRLQYVGGKHFEKHVRLTKDEWHIFRTLMEQFLTTGTLLELNGTRSAAHAITSVIVQQMCTGATIAKSNSSAKPDHINSEGQRLLRSSSAHGKLSRSHGSFKPIRTSGSCRSGGLTVDISSCVHGKLVCNNLTLNTSNVTSRSVGFNV